jgi:glutamate-1-semialdehyde 2,1-aminomutase
MMTRGVYPPPSQFEAWFISTAHTQRDVDMTIRAAKAAIREVASGAQPSALQGQRRI